ncbi:MAG: argininosuccinate lyase [Alphaproteobacteria bacterium]|nr:argininosuccinate lyase [Alphaproteobacteria bacterium]MCL2505571.1 argininosuccinate lyase [Alphaproteobacteria bacterium]
MSEVTKNTKLWGGRFDESTSSDVEAFTESVSYDKNLYTQDIRGSKAHSEMLAKCGILSEKDMTDIHEGLDKILAEIEQGTFIWKPELEDVHMNIESRLTELVGDAGKKLHTARSRNDQVATDFRLFVAEAMTKWRTLCLEFIAVLLERAQKEVNTLLPGYTHMQPAQPVSLAQHMMAYAWMLKRDIERIDDALKRVLISPLGAAALAGTTYNINPEFSAERLGFAGEFDNSMDAVSDRDFAIEALSAGSIIMMHLSRFCEEIIIWSSPAFGFIRLSDAHSTGSSIMPQKRNPDLAELVRGKTGRVYGSLQQMLVMMKGLPLAYNRDMQEDKESFFDADRTVANSLSMMAAMIENCAFNRERMSMALKAGFLNATELADYLAAKGIPFREAHKITGHAVAYAEKAGKALEELSLEDLQSIEPSIQEDVFEVLDYEAAVNRRNSKGGVGRVSLFRQFEDMKKFVRESEGK